jgi:geranylgeranyl diphosphate synthase, type II
MNGQSVPRESSSSFAEVTQSLGSRVNAALDARATLGEGCPARLREAMRHSLLAPGKRMRPLLVLLAAKACGGDVEAALPAACAVEMVHAYSLIHDDLPALDNDDLRRGRPTCHKAFDEATAILAGDALLTLAFETLAKEIQPPATAAACCAALAEAAGPCNMVGGQADDVEAERNDECRMMNDECPPIHHSSFSIHHLESIHHRKTGAMIRVSLRLGAIVAGAGAEQLAALDTYGKCLGLAFQITDDLLDVRGTEAEMGKRVRKDARQQKLTFPGLLGVEESDKYAQAQVAEARCALSVFGDEADPLRALAQYVLERNR